MPFRELYAFSQKVTDRIHRDALRAEAVRLSGLDRVAVMRSDLDTEHCRGMYLSLKNNGHQFVKQHGCNVIVLARKLDKFWQRYVFTKELMHVFSDPSEATDTGEKFEQLLIELSVGEVANISAATRCEIDCAWMALAVLCPRERRDNYRHARSRGDIDDYRISQELRISEQQVYHLLHDAYNRNLKRIFEQLNAK